MFRCGWQIVPGLQTRSEKKYFVTLIQLLCRYSLCVQPQVRVELEMLVEMNMLHAA